jgi:hypothetical protein
MSTHSWRDHALCASEDPAIWEDLDVPGLAKSWCRRCPVTVQCATTAMEAERGRSLRVRGLIFGGMTPRERWEADPTTRPARRITPRWVLMPPALHPVPAASAVRRDDPQMDRQLGQLGCNPHDHRNSLTPAQGRFVVPQCRRREN